MTYEQELCQFTETIWKSILDLEVTRSPKVFKPSNLENTLCSCVHIMGEWEGTVAVHCPVTLARKVAGIMFSEPEDETDSSEIQDALGELANMTGGNIKSLLPEPCYLSLPTVAVTQFGLRIPGSSPLTQVTFECANNLFAVSILTKNANNN